MCALSLECACSFDWLIFTSNGINFGRQEGLAIGILGKLPAHDIGKIDNMHGNTFPTEMLARRESSGSGNQRAIRSDGYRMEQSHILDGVGKLNNIAKVVAMPFAHNNVVDREGMLRALMLVGFHYLLFINKVKNAVVRWGGGPAGNHMR